MTSTTSITDLPSTVAKPGEAPFTAGDMALVIGKDGGVRNIAFNIDTSRLSVDPDDMTEEDFAVLEQGSRIFALTLAANTPLLMNMLMEIASNPDVIDTDAIKRFARMN